MELTEKISLMMDKGELLIAIFIDLTKAFDTLNHKILLDKLHYYGLRSDALYLIHSNLTNRMLHVEIEGVRSNLLSISTVVP